MVRIRNANLLLAVILVAAPTPAVADCYQYSTSWNNNGAAFNNVRSVECGADGRVYVLEGNYVQIFDGSGGRLQTWGPLAGVSGLTRDFCRGPADTIFISMGDAKVVWKLSPAGEVVARFGDSGSGDNEVLLPGAIAADGQGRVFVVDASRHRVMRFSRSGTLLGHFGSQGSGDGQFQFIGGLAVDGDGKVYVSDSQSGAAPNSRIQVFDGQGGFLSRIDVPACSEGGNERIDTLFFDENNNLYAVRRLDNPVSTCVQKLDRSGQALCTWGSHGTEPGQLLAPADCATGPDGRAYVLDQGQDTDPADTLVKVFTVGPEPVELTTWGAIKARFR